MLDIKCPLGQLNVEHLHNMLGLSSTPRGWGMTTTLLTLLIQRLERSEARLGYFVIQNLGCAGWVLELAMKILEHLELPRGRVGHGNMSITFQNTDGLEKTLALTSNALVDQLSRGPDVDVGYDHFRFPEAPSA